MMYPSSSFMLLVLWAIFDSRQARAFSPSYPIIDHGVSVSNRRDLFVRTVQLATAAATLSPLVAQARLESVNRPDLLPREAGLNVIQIEKFLTTGQAKRMDELLKALERDTGFRVRVLCQAYPMTPGLAM
jgi:hypothetical protein